MRQTDILAFSSNVLMPPDVLLQDQFQLGDIRLAAVDFQLVETKMAKVCVVGWVFDTYTLSGCDVIDV